MTRFSVVIPCYNQGAFLAECLQSVRQQTHAVHQIIVVDDGSTDPFTVEQLDKLCTGGIELVRQSNGGLPAARNAGIRVASGEWILPLDCDDMLRADAVERFVEAIEREPEVAIWYPDVEHFGVRQGEYQNPEFDAWRLLWMNQMVCASAIRREVFDAGVRYNEKMRGGYEDWEFGIHACCERGFRAKRLAQPVFRYRQWGYSMLSASSERDAELRSQIQRERPIYTQPDKLLALKKASAPFFAIATESTTLGRELAAQSFGDFRVVDESGAIARAKDLAGFAGHPSRFMLVVFDERQLRAALRDDVWLLERVARQVLATDAALTWLGDRVAAVVSVAHCFAHRAMPNGEDLRENLARYAAKTGGQTSRLALFAEDAPRVTQQRRSMVIRSPEALRESVFHFAKGASRLVRAVVGPELHDRLLERGPRGLLHWTRSPSGNLLGARWSRGKTPISDLDTRAENALWAVTRDKPLFPTGAQPSVLVVVEDSREDRRLLELVKSLRAATTVILVAPAPSAELRASVDGAFSLAGWPSLVDLAERFSARQVLFVDALASLDNLPSLRRAEPSRKLSFVGLAENPPGLTQAASRYNNLLDRYWLSHGTDGETLRRLYVSPSKIRLIADGLADLTEVAPRPLLRRV
jgi:hypothetical protein